MAYAIADADICKICSSKNRTIKDNEKHRLTKTHIRKVKEKERVYNDRIKRKLHKVHEQLINHFKPKRAHFDHADENLYVPNIMTKVTGLPEELTLDNSASNINLMTID